MHLTRRTFFNYEGGAFLEATLGIDLTGYAASDLTFTLRYPDGTSTTLSTNRIIIDSVPGVVRVDLASANLRQNGEHFLQVKAVKTSLPTQRSQLGSFFVDDHVVSSVGDLWAPAGVPNYAAATAAEKARYAFWGRAKWS